MKNLKEQLNSTFHNILVPPILSAISTISPLIGISLLTAYGFYGVAMQYKQNEVNEFVQILIDNPGIFTEEIVKTKEFQDGFLIIFESYLKERNKEKRKIIKNIFLGFTKLSEAEKEKFELEKMIDISNRITINDIKYLKFIKFFIIDSNKNIFGNIYNLNNKEINNLFIYEQFTGDNLNNNQIKINNLVNEISKLLNINYTLDNLHNKITLDNLPKEIHNFILSINIELQDIYRNNLQNLSLLRISIHNNKIQYYITPSLIKFISYISEDES